LIEHPERIDWHRLFCQYQQNIYQGEVITSLEIQSRPFVAFHRPSRPFPHYWSFWTWNDGIEPTQQNRPYWVIESNSSFCPNHGQTEETSHIVELEVRKNPTLKEYQVDPNPDLDPRPVCKIPELFGDMPWLRHY
jgi:hypothetical protein